MGKYIYRKEDREEKIFYLLVHFPNGTTVGDELNRIWEPGASDGPATWMLRPKDLDHPLLLSQARSREVMESATARIQI